MDRPWRLALGVWLAVAFAPVAKAQDSLATAKALYASAAYEDALSVLTRLKAVDSTPAAAVGVDQYRAFCLLALGRTAEAERAIEDIVSIEPLYQPNEADTSPRLRAVFRTVRTRLLPAIAQQQYAAAKATFDRKEYREAVDQFTRAIALLNDPDVDAVTDPRLADIRTLVAGFLDLSLAASLPPPPADPPLPAPAPPAPAAPPTPRLYRSGDPGVVLPVPLRQAIPSWPAKLPFLSVSTSHGVIEVVIDEGGAVESAVIRNSVNHVYDAMLIEAAKSWRYRPALKDGQPVKFVSRVRVSVEPR